MTFQDLRPASPRLVGIRHRMKGNGWALGWSRVLQWAAASCGRQLWKVGCAQGSATLSCRRGTLHTAHCTPAHMCRHPSVTTNIILNLPTSCADLLVLTGGGDAIPERLLTRCWYKAAERPTALSSPGPPLQLSKTQYTQRPVFSAKQNHQSQY